MGHLAKNEKRDSLVIGPGKAITLAPDDPWAWQGDFRYATVARVLHWAGIEPAEFGNNGMTFSLGEVIHQYPGVRALGANQRYQVESAIYAARDIIGLSARMGYGKLSQVIDEPNAFAIDVIQWRSGACESVGNPAYGPAYLDPDTFAGIFFLTLKDALATRKLELPAATLLLSQGAPYLQS